MTTNTKRPNEDAIARAKRRVLERRGQATNYSRPSTREKGENTASKSRGTDTRGTNTPDEGQSRRAELLSQTTTQSSTKSSGIGHGGLNVALHPLLRGITPTLPRNHNPVKQKVQARFDPLAINPYLEQQNAGGRRARPLELNPKGKYIAAGNELRQRAEHERQLEAKRQEAREKNLLPDESIGEHLYKLVMPPSVEWWDAPFVKGQYEELVPDNEKAPVTSYIQHPVFVAAPWEKHLAPPKPLYLTKKESKRIRRNERQRRLKDQQDRIKLGLEPPPPPKVKLSNLMNVLTNEAIQDPTGVEKRVRREMDERFHKHMQQNEERKLSKEEKHEKIKDAHEKDLAKGYFTTVYRISNLDDPQHFFKVDINAKQLDFVGIVLKNPKYNLVIVEGGEKGIKFYKKLLTRRIPWTGTCEVLWEGQLKELHFRKWSVMYLESDDDALAVLAKFNCTHYWTAAANAPATT